MSSIVQRSINFVRANPVAAYLIGGIVLAGTRQN